MEFAPHNLAFIEELYAQYLRDPASVDDQWKRLFEPIAMRSLTARHRLWVAAMCQYSALDGVVQPWHLVHLGSFAIGRAGLIITEATAITPVSAAWMRG